ncbi:transposase ISC1250 [Sulfolobus islandicus M.16.27]|uniref:Transposase ISC1250 n=1 Tax=Saccharolobus islandicus (strain M.16.27) TaxID=427318 RepID=C3N4P2_SACI3|nr:transposase ISC1250 [Sulfolobus islandicus M.16.27]
METISIDKKALYNLTRRSEAIEELTRLNGGNLTLVLNILSEDALLNKSVKEIERIALEEAERTSQKYTREKEIRRKGYAKYKFLNEFKIVLKGRKVIYKLEWISVELPVLYGDKGRVKTQVEERLLREEKKAFTALMSLYSVLGGKLNAKLWMPEIQASGDFKYVIVDGKYVRGYWV